MTTEKARKAAELQQQIDQMQRWVQGVTAKKGTHILERKKKSVPDGFNVFIGFNSLDLHKHEMEEWRVLFAKVLEKALRRRLRDLEYLLKNL